MILPYSLVIVYPLLTLNSSYTHKDTIPYQPYTTTNMMQNYDIKVYERFWDSILKDNIDITP